MQEEKMSELAQRVFLELCPVGEVWELKKILDLLKKPEGQEKIAFWREKLQISLDSFLGKTLLQKEKQSMEAVQELLPQVLSFLVEKKQIHVLFETTSQGKRLPKYTLAFPQESYASDREIFLARLTEEAEKAKKQAEEERARREQEETKKAAEEEARRHAEEEQETARIEQARQERTAFILKIGEAIQRQTDALHNFTTILSQGKDLAEASLATYEELQRKIQLLLEEKPIVKKEAKTNKKAKEPKEAPAPALAQEPYEHPSQGSLEKSVEEVCEELFRAYWHLRNLQKHPAIRIPALRRELQIPRKLFEQAILRLAQTKKIDLLASDEEDFTFEETTDAYYDPEQECTYYYLQWR